MNENTVLFSKTQVRKLEGIFAIKVKLEKICSLKKKLYGMCE